jgi:hypothetical protein
VTSSSTTDRTLDPLAELPPILVPAIGAAPFGAAAAALGVEAINRAVLDASKAGAGQWLSGAMVAGTAAVWFGAGFVRALTPSLAG